VEILV
jgi:nicotinate-nucleotide pyrophosphorylase (carboxylating)